MRPIGGLLPSAGPFRANQGLPVPEAHRISLEPTGRRMPILNPMISIENGVPEPHLFALQHAIFPIQLGYAPAFSAAGTIQCELRWSARIYYVLWHSSLAGSYKSRIATILTSQTMTQTLDACPLCSPCLPPGTALDSSCLLQDPHG
jgi:hypothetical protein